MGTNEALLRRFFDWLCMTYPTNEPPRLEIAPVGYMAVEVDGEYGFGVYVPSELAIHVVQTVPPEFRDEEWWALCTFLAHEYRHHMQVMDGRPVSEEDAGEFAEIAVERWMSESA